MFLSVIRVDLNKQKLRVYRSLNIMLPSNCEELNLKPQHLYKKLGIGVHTYHSGMRDLVERTSGVH